MRRALVVLLAIAVAAANLAPLALAQGEAPPLPAPIQGWEEKLRTIGTSIARGAFIAGLILTVVSAVCKFAVGKIESDVAPGGVLHLRGLGKVFDAFASLFWFFIGIVVLLWSIDVLNWFGLLPPALQPFVPDLKGVLGWGGG